MQTVFKRLGRHFKIVLITTLAVGSAFAQDPDKPLALLRQTQGTDNYFILVHTNAKLTADNKVSAILSNKSTLVNWEQDVKDCSQPEVGRFCKAIADNLLVMTYHLTSRPEPTDRLKISFAVTDKSGSGTFRSIDLINDFKAGGPRIDEVCGNGLMVDLQADNPRVENNQAERDYYRSRLVALNSWLRRSRSAPAAMATIHLEPLTKPDPPEPTIRSFTVSPSADSRLSPQELDIETALASQKVVLCFQFDQKLPNEKFNARVVLRNDPPVEFERPLVKAITGPKTMGAPIASKVPEDNKLGLRALDNNLELGTLFTSSVKEVKVNNVQTRQRQSRGALDLRFAPLLRNRQRPPITKNWQPFWTPFFIDAKVSSGKISEDTLSLNRILFGTELNLRYVAGTEKGERDKYVVVLRGTNASDRDFKLAEVKGEFEFRPIFEELNQPLKTRHNSFRSVLIPDGPPKEIQAGGWFGYQIQPFIGFELGNVYRRSRSAFKTEEQDDNVRRLLFGVDIAFNLTPRITLSMSDIFYIRGETPTHRQRNYFNGTVEAPLGNLNRYASQSVFFSWERGNQPPFATPAVNALKFGYRVRSDFFDTGSAH